MEIYGKIEGISYRPFLTTVLNQYNMDQLDYALSEIGSFIIEINKDNRIAISRWVSSKRTRSYPYSRVYDTLGFSGKRVTIIPVIKDEGKDGDRDFLQWDTVSLMSLLGIYVIIAYYDQAVPSRNFKNKITDQKFNLAYIKNEINKLMAYQSDALHWNLEQIDKIFQVATLALESYEKISKNLGIEMHSKESAQQRINKLYKEKENFMKFSREEASKAQKRESQTIQPKEFLTGTKAMITITNYLGGNYYFTCDEVEVHGNEIYLIEGKHGINEYPSLADVKDGLLKMILYTNLKKVYLNNKEFTPVPFLKLTTKGNPAKFPDYYDTLLIEAKTNNFKIMT